MHICFEYVLAVRCMEVKRALLCREVIVTNADKVHAINQLVGDHEMPTCWGFGKRRIKGALQRFTARTPVGCHALACGVCRTESAAQRL